MQFLKEIREHLANYETEAAAEIHKFIDWLHTKYVEPIAPVVALPSDTSIQVPPTFTPAVDNTPEVITPVGNTSTVEVVAETPAPV